MTISRQRFEDVKLRWGDYSSWALWQSISAGEKPKAHVGDLPVLNPDQDPRRRKQSPSAGAPYEMVAPPAERAGI
ncbi:hypothetical protein BH10ACT6_BH10ACT6_12720 [soil metagenome]